MFVKLAICTTFEVHDVPPLSSASLTNFYFTTLEQVVL